MGVTSVIIRSTKIKKINKILKIYYFEKKKIGDAVRLNVPFNLILMIDAKRNILSVTS